MNDDRIGRVVVCTLTAGALLLTACGESGSGAAISRDKLAEVCVRLSACAGVPFDGYLGIQRSFSAVNGERRTWFEQRVSCILEAPDCTAVLACEGTDPTKECEEGSDVQCEGDHLVACDELHSGEHYVQELACDERDPDNDQCFAVTAHHALCGVGTCSDDDEDRCEGNTLVECTWGALAVVGPGVHPQRVEVRHDCEDLGKVCVQDGDMPRCLADATPCADGSYCEGDVLVVCDHKSVEERVDCPALDPDFTCVVVNDDHEPEARCQVPADKAECEAEDMDLEDRAEGDCQGDVARVCLGGKWFPFDCSSFLGAQCGLTDLDEDNYVRCKAPNWP